VERCGFRLPAGDGSVPGGSRWAHLAEGHAWPTGEPMNFGSPPFRHRFSQMLQWPPAKGDDARTEPIHFPTWKSDRSTGDERNDERGTGRRASKTTRPARRGHHSPQHTALDRSGPLPPTSPTVFREAQGLTGSPDCLSLEPTLRGGGSFPLWNRGSTSLRVSNRLATPISYPASSASTTDTAWWVPGPVAQPPVSAGPWARGT